MVKCHYCPNQDLDEFDTYSDDDWYNSVGYCEICNRWYSVVMCQHCQNETIDEITDKEILQDFNRDYMNK